MKTNKTHTPGPWRVSHDPMNPNPRIIGTNKEIVTVVSSGAFFAKPTEANARLIAAAPQLVKTAEALLRRLDAMRGQKELAMGEAEALRLAVYQALGQVNP